MKKNIWYLLVPLMAVFLLGNALVTNFALTQLCVALALMAERTSTVWFLILPLLACLIDLWLGLGLSSSRKINAEEGMWNSTLLFYIWLFLVFANACLVCFAAFVYFHFTLPTVMVIGLVYFLVRAGLFVLAPIFIVS